MGPLFLGLGNLLGERLGRLETAGALLVHLGAGGHTVDGEIEKLARLHELHKFVEERKNGQKHLLARQVPKFVRVPMGARVDDPVHVQVEVVHLCGRGALSVITRGSLRFVPGGCRLHLRHVGVEEDVVVDEGVAL